MPKGFRDMKRDLEKQPTRKISPELRKMHEIFGDQNADCGMAAQYDPAKMSFRKRVEIQQSTEQQPPTNAEHQAELVRKFISIVKEGK